MRPITCEQIACIFLKNLNSRFVALQPVEGKFREVANRLQAGFALPVDQAKGRESTQRTPPVLAYQASERLSQLSPILAAGKTLFQLTNDFGFHPIPGDEGQRFRVAANQP